MKFFICQLLTFVCCFAHASKKEPLNITSDEMTCDNETHKCEAIGRAKAFYQDAGGEKSIKAPKLVSILKKKNDAKGESTTTSEIETLEAYATPQESVEIDLTTSKGEKIHITCQKVSYDYATQVATLQGPVLILKGENILQGDKGVVDFKNSTYTLSSTSTQAQALFYPTEKK